MSAKHELLLLRRYELRGDVTVEDLGIDLRPTNVAELASDTGNLQSPPPELDRRVQAVYDARPSFTREFCLQYRDAAVPTSGLEASYVFTDFVFDVPQGYLGVLRYVTINIPTTLDPDTQIYLALLRNGEILPDYATATVNPAPAAGTPSALLIVSQAAGVFLTDQSIAVYVEVPPGGTFALRFFNNEPTAPNLSINVTAQGQFLRADTVPAELQVATPPQVTPVVIVASELATTPPPMPVPVAASSPSTSSSTPAARASPAPIAPPPAARPLMRAPPPIAPTRTPTFRAKR